MTTPHETAESYAAHLLGLRCDGPFPAGEPDAAIQWMVIDETSPAFAASFYVKPGEELGTKFAEVTRRFKEEGE